MQFRSETKQIIGPPFLNVLLHALHVPVMQTPARNHKLFLRISVTTSNATGDCHKTG